MLRERDAAVNRPIGDRAGNLALVDDARLQQLGRERNVFLLPRQRLARIKQPRLGESVFIRRDGSERFGASSAIGYSHS